MHALRVCTGAKGGCTCQRKCGERVAPIFGNGLMTNAFEICQRNSRAGASTGNHNQPLRTFLFSRLREHHHLLEPVVQQDGVHDVHVESVTQERSMVVELTGVTHLRKSPRALLRLSE